MKFFFYTAKSKKMRKNEIILLKFLPFVLMLFIIQMGIANNPSKNFNKSYDATIACNDTVNVAMDFDCITEVFPDQLLEGDYPDMGIFEVTIYDENDQPIGNTVTGDQVGLTLVAEVFDTTTGNKCWSHINIIDIVGPPLVCDTIYTTCYDDFVPGTLTPHNFRFAFHPDTDIPDNDTLRLSLEVGKVSKAKITDLNVILDISHQNDIDLAAYLVSPANDTVDLFDQLTCGGENFYVEFDDEAEKTANDLTNECKPSDPAVKGKFQSVGNLYDFDGEYLSGTWTLVVIDKNAGNTGKVNNVFLLFKQNGGFVNFPIPTGSSTPVDLGDNKFYVESGFEPCGSATLSYSDSLIQMDCSTDYTGLIQRSWEAVDESGNISLCTQYIYIIRTGTAFLQWPHDFDDIDLPVLACKPNDPDFYPGPEVTGAPGEELCNMVTVSHSDQVIDVCSGSYKIIRHWKVSEMCSGDILEHDQLISVMDKTGPVIENVPNISMATDALECTKNIYLNLPEVISDCSDFDLISFEVGYQILDQAGNPETVDLLYDNLELLNNGQYLLHNAPVGKIKVTYIATDDCGNSTSTYNIITIYDNDPPVAVCDQHTQVSIGTDGTAKTEAFVYDDGSHDNCSDISFKVRRMTTTCDSTDLFFKDSISFCCADVGTTQMVELKVTDESGLSNTCMVEVNIVDKFPPVVICPDDINIKCDADYTDLKVTGKATAYDNCEVTDLEYEDFSNISQCNTGLIRRTWTAYDANGYHSSCTQLISITDFHKFKGSDIVWPKDTTFYDCVENFDTSITGSVIFLNEDFCSMVSARYEDENFNVVDGACKKILRHWEVIDWCNFNENDPDQTTWKHTQVIMLQNEEAPVFDETCHERTFCTYG
ncbi:MAG TPA: hypothetical protein ENK91_01185, partial [Bacteroidetes bacterium]|nr:hypothetical protein [Bacteroidota bacterium]